MLRRRRGWFEDDTDALRSDWEAVGRDLWNAIDKVTEEAIDEAIEEAFPPPVND